MTIPQFLKLQKRHSGHYLSFAIGLGLTAGFLLIIQAWLLAGIVNDVIFEKTKLAEVQSRLWAMLALFLLRAVLAWVSEQAAFRAAAGVKLQLRDRLYRHLQQLGPHYLSHKRSGDLVNTLSDGVEALESYYARFLPAMSLMVFVPLSILVFIFPVDWISGLIMLGTAPLIPLFMVFIGKGAERLNQRQWRKLARMSAHFLDVIQGLTTLKMFNASRQEAKAVGRISEEYRHDTMAVLRMAFLSSLVLEFFATVSIALVAILIGFRLYWGDMDFAHGFFVLLLAPEFYLPLRSMGTHYHARMEAIAAAERMVDILETPIPKEASGRAPAPDLKQVSIQFQQVQFTYEAGRDALNDVSFELHPGERLALVGPSGAGKTTIINLLLGFIAPNAGDIKIGEIPLLQIDPAQWRQHIAWVPQNPKLFHGSLLDNICLGQTDIDLPAVHKATRLARADEFINRLPDGYDTLIGEQGVGLSGGQIQRIALARAFLKNAPLVILDEATANLDLQSEALIREAILELSQQRMMLTIAHRLNTVRDADRILVLNTGRIREQGSHTELIKADGLYQQMVQAHGAST
jgi:ATP-binding cassette subfamily C protein CydD